MNTYKMDIEKDLLQTEVGQGALKGLVGPGDPPTQRQRRKKQEGGFISRLFNLGKGTTNKSTMQKTRKCRKRHADTGECMDDNLA